MSFSNQTFFYPAIDAEIDRILKAKSGNKAQQTKYDTPSHAEFVNDADWTLLNYTIRKHLGETHTPRAMMERQFSFSCR